MEEDTNKIDVMQLFDAKSLVKICAPMVRYSKLQFRTLVRNYGCDLCFTPMILADSFCKSEKARNNEFTTNLADKPLIVQFAANTVHDFAGAAHMVSPYCNGVDLNVGCPQRWAKQMGIGCAMLDRPELIYDLVRECRNRIDRPFTVSVKTRILKDIRKSVEICKRLEKAGVSFLTIHARTPSQSSGDINSDHLKLICENVGCPVVANGGVKSLEDCYSLQDKVKCKGVMVANALLNNPTLFSGRDETSLGCVQTWLDICFNSTLTLNTYDTQLKPTSIPEKPLNLTFQCFHHHLVFMLEKLLPRCKRRIFNNLQKFQDVLDFLKLEFGLSANLYNKVQFCNEVLLNLNYEGRNDVYNRLLETNELNGRPDGISCGEVCQEYNYEGSDGKYFKNKIKEGGEKAKAEDLICGFSDIFIEND